jgi:hypothetical protein
MLAWRPLRQTMILLLYVHITTFLVVQPKLEAFLMILQLCDNILVVQPKLEAFLMILPFYNNIGHLGFTTILEKLLILVSQSKRCRYRKKYFLI